MAIEFERPFVLIFAAILGILVWVVSRKFSKEGLGKRFAVYLRIFIIFLIILALSMPSVSISSGKITTIYLADLSESNKKNIEKMKEFIQKSIKLKKSGEMQSIVVFGKDANIEFLPKRNPNFSEFTTSVDGTQTNIEEAIRFAASLFSKDSRKRLVILTDGKETEGDTKNVAELVKTEGIDVKVVLFQSQNQKDVQLSSLKLAQRVFKNQEFSIFANIDSTFDTEALLKVYRDNQLIFSRNIGLEKGENRLVIKDKLAKEGIYSYKAVIEAADDEEDSNNEGYAMCMVEKPIRVLLIYDNVDDARNIESLLDKFTNDYDAMEASRVDFEMNELSRYSFVILCNVSKGSMSSKFLSSLDKYVKDLGGGLVVIGGENSYALGGYEGSLLEKMLPVRMQIKNKEKEKSLDVVIVLDHSGSMGEQDSSGVPKLEIAKTASAKMIENLQSSDNVGVIAFDHEYYWAHEFGKLSDKDAAVEDISAIELGGGTAIIPPLKEAINKLKSSKSKEKLVILMTDGIGEQSGYEDPVLEAKKYNIKITTIGVGQSINAPVLSWMASETSGRFYYVPNAEELINVFLKEAKIVKGKYIKEKKFVPKNVEKTTINSGFLSYPPLYGYIATTKKELATSVLVSDEDEPILTIWRYGLGKVAAWCSDLSGQWSRDWILWEKFSQFWTKLFKWVEKGDSDGNFDFDVKKDKNLVVSLSGKFDADANVKIKTLFPNGQEKLLSMKRVAADRFESNVDLMLGNYVFVVILSSKNQTKVSSYFYSVNYSDEFRIDLDYSRFEQFISLSGARIIKKPSEVYQGKLSNVESKFDISNFIVILCIFLFLLDVAIRRFGLYYQVEKVILKAERATKKAFALKGVKIALPKDSFGKFKKAALSKKEKTEGQADDGIIDVKKLRRF